MKRYTHLTHEERYYIYTAMQSGKSVLKIAQEIGRSKSTIYRELHRNKGKKGYRHKQAHAKACKRQTDKVKTCISHEVWILVRKYLDCM